MKDEVKQHSWKVGQATHEGFPLLLRYPDDIEYENPKSRFPILVTITHKLALVQDSGLPERTYNETLEDFDVYLTRLFEIKNAGVVVLVETFGGNRAYYFYVSRDLDLLAEESNIKAQYPQHELSWERQEDATWSFIKRYARDFNFT